MVKQKSKFKGLFKGVAIGFAFIMCTAFFPVNAIAGAVENITDRNKISLNSIKVNGNSADLTVKKGDSVKIPEGEYEYKNADGQKAKHIIGSADESGIKSSVDVFYKATNDKISKSSDGKSFIADRVGRYTIVYTVEENGMTYSYDLTIKCEVGEAVFDFSSNSKNIIPSVYDLALTSNDIILPMPSIKDGEDEVIIDENENDYFTNLDKDDYQLPSDDEKESFVTISIAKGSNVSVKSREVEGKTEYYISNADLANIKGQDVQVFYSYYQMSENGPVFVSSTSKTFSVKEGYYLKKADSEEKGYELETSWSSSVSDITAIVGVERELPKITATTKSSNSPASEAIEVYYTIKVEKRASNGRYEIDVTDDVLTEDGKFKANDEGSYKFTYTVKDFYGNTVSQSRTSFEITNVKDSRSASVYVYDAGNKDAYNEEDNTYASALNMLKSQTGNRNIIMYAVGGTDNFVAKEELALRRTILDNTAVTMFDISEKAYNDYNLIFAPARRTGASAESSIYQQIVSDNYHLRNQMLMEGKKVDDDNEIKAFLKEHKYLLVTTEFNKDVDGNDIVENLDSNDADAVTKMMLLDKEGEVGYAYIKPKNSNRKTFTDGTYTFIYGASDKINNETTSRYSVVVSADYVDETVPTLSFTSDLQAVYLASDTIEFNVATATDATSQDSRLDTVTAYRYLGADKSTPVSSSKTDSTLKYYIERANSNLSSKWYAETGKVIESAGWFVDNSKSVYTVNLADKPQDAKYLEILAYAIDDYGNAGFFNKIIRIADVQDELMPVLYRAENIPTSDDKFEAPKEIELPTLYFTDDNVDYMFATVNVYKIIRNEANEIVGKLSMQSSQMLTDFDSYSESFMVKAGSFRASTAGEYQVAITVSDAGNHNYTTYFNYNVGGGVVFDKPEIENITSETIELKAGQSHYLVPPTLSIVESSDFGYVGVDEDDDAKTATYYTTTIISATDSYKLDKYYFTGNKKGTFKLQYRVYLMQYSKDSNVFASSASVANNGMIFLENGKLIYKYNNEKYFVKIVNVDGEYVLGANTSLQGDGLELNDNQMKVLEEIVKVYTCESKIQTINVGGVEMTVTFDENVYAESYEELGKEIKIEKPNVEFNGSDYQTNNEDSVVTITKTSGNTTTTLATIPFAKWENGLPENNSNFVARNGEIFLTLADNGRYTIKYSIQAMDKTEANVGEAKVVEYTIKNGDVVGPEVTLGKNLVKTKYKLGETMKIQFAGFTVSDNATEDVEWMKENMTIRIRNTTLDDSYTKLENESDVKGEYIYTHKLDRAGSYTLTFIVKDKAGNETSQSVSFEVTTDEKSDVDVKEVMGGVLIGLSVAILAGVVIYFVVSKVKLDKKEKKYKDK